MNRAQLVAVIVGALLVPAAAVPVALGAWNPLTTNLVEGIDVSAHQGPIDWDAVTRGDVRFAYMKATEGSDFVDPRFAFNWRGAERAGIARGAYHYFTLCRSGAQQAANFIRTVPRSASALPPAVDLEHMGPCLHGPTATHVDEEITRFLDIVEAHYGVRPILYTTREFHDAHLSALPRERWWIRSLYTPPEFRRGEWVIWQHHNGAHRAGISEPVDLDAFRGDEAALRALTRRAEPST